MNFEIFLEKSYITIELSSFGKYIIFFDELVEFSSKEYCRDISYPDAVAWLRENFDNIQKLYPEIFL